MNRCTVCGATSREGAKFCTSCGARLGEGEVQQAATGNVVSGDDVASPETTDTAVQQTVTAPQDTDDAIPEDTTSAELDVSDTENPADDDDHYVSSWPDAESSDDTQERFGTEDAPESATTGPNEDADFSSASDGDTGWPNTSEPGDDEGAVITAPAPESFATDADQDPDPRETAGASADTDHHGASEWEGWAPVPSTTSSVAGTVTEPDAQVEHVHQLLDELKHRIDRITKPASLESRDLDPDDLADQLERWSRAVPDSDELLEAVKEARRSPRDIDAMMRLSDRAADLELLVRHYQSITSTSDEWAADLRRTRTGETDA